MVRKVLRPIFCISFSLALVGYSIQSQLLATVQSKPNKGSQSNYRLPAWAKPSQYDLYFRPEINKGNFSAQETISIELNQSSKYIVLNSKELNISSATISGNKIKTLAATLSTNKELEQITLSFSKPLPPGNYQLNLKFTGMLSNKLTGFYKASFNDKTGKKHFLAATQMEPTDARTMFPCFDEPAFKAQFKITTSIDPTYTAISNAPITSTTLDRTGRKIVSFAASEKMSSYLVALLIGEFKAGKTINVGDVPITVWSTPDKTNLTKYATEIAAKILPYYNDYFKISYPWKKLDLIAIPDFEAGAMENPGAITFRELFLLVDDKKASVGIKQDVAGVVAHEMAHLWFGDLVTMKWWDDLWLNEAFASWMAIKAVDHVIPQWQYANEYGNERLHSMQTDSLVSTRSIHHPVGNPAQAHQMFDSITYSKGASILSMLETYVGADAFQEGVDKYLSAHSWGNATTQDLWQAISDITKQDINKIMHNWVYEPGYPMISFTNKDGQLAIEQKRFFLNPNLSDNSQTWSVPIAFRDLDNQSDALTNLLFEQNKLQLDKNWLAKIIFANAGGAGYYRVLYSAEKLKAILPHFNTLSTLERLQLLSDQYALAISQKTSISNYLEMLNYYKNENNPIIIQVLVGQLHYLYRYVDLENKTKFEELVRNLLSDIKTKLGWKAEKDESDLTKLARSAVLTTLGTIGQDQQTIDKARKLFSQYLKNHDSVEGDLLSPMTNIVAFNGNAHDYETIKNLFKTAKDPESESRNLQALVLFQNQDLTSKTLALTLSNEMRIQDAPHLLGSLWSSKFGSEQAWQFIKQNWLLINKKYPQSMLPALITGADSFSTKLLFNDYKTFFANHKVIAGESNLARTIEKININISFKDLPAKEFNNWLSKY